MPLFDGFRQVAAWRGFVASRTVRAVVSTAALAAPAVVGSAGCSIDMMALPYFLFADEPTVPPAVVILDGKRDKKKIMVLSYADSNLRFGFDAVDEDLCNLVVSEVTTAEDRIEVVPERDIRKWRDL
ncbi:MAG: hypothetical protein ACRDD1_10875, partial [Planctomycetia bacterium]